MKNKSLILIITMLSMLMCFTACSKEAEQGDINKMGTLYGKWTTTKVYYEDEAMPITELDMQECSLTLNEDGTCELIMEDILTGKWELTKAGILVKSDNEELEFVQHGNTLTYTEGDLVIPLEK